MDKQEAQLANFAKNVTVLPCNWRIGGASDTLSNAVPVSRSPIEQTSRVGTYI